MNESRRRAREVLLEATRQAFCEITTAAKITTEDQKILDKKFIDGLSNLEIALELNYSLERVNRTIKKAYDKVARLI